MILEACPALRLWLCLCPCPLWSGVWFEPHSAWLSVRSGRGSGQMVESALLNKSGESEEGHRRLLGGGRPRGTPGHNG